MSKSMKVGPYTVAESLGTGSFATVFKGVNNNNSKDVVAIKCIAIARLTEDIASALESEIALQRQLVHENIVRLIGVNRSSKYIFLTLQYCAGGDLAHCLRRVGALDEPTCLRLLRDLSAGLRHLHDRNLAHRDIKPQNLLLSSPDVASARLLIGDFGFARSLPPEALASTLVGSPLYMSPELLQFKPYNTRADLWSVGVVLAEMLVGRPPFSGLNPMDLLAHILAVPWLRGTVDAAAAAPDDSTCGGILPPGVAERVSPECKAVLRGLLRVDPEFRMSHQEFFGSPWLQGRRLAELASSSPARQAPDTGLSIEHEPPATTVSATSSGSVEVMAAHPYADNRKNISCDTLSSTAAADAPNGSVIHPYTADHEVAGKPDPRPCSTDTLGAQSASLHDVAEASLHAFRAAQTLRLAATYRSQSFLVSCAAASADVGEGFPAGLLPADFAAACHVESSALPTSVTDFDAWLQHLELAQLCAQSCAFSAAATAARDCSKQFLRYAAAGKERERVSGANEDTGFLGGGALAQQGKGSPGLDYASVLAHPDAGLWATWAASLGAACAATADLEADTWVIVDPPT